MVMLSNGLSVIEAYKVTGISSGEFQEYHGYIVGRNQPTFILEDYSGDKFVVKEEHLKLILNNNKSHQLWAVITNNRLNLRTELDLRNQGYLKEKPMNTHMEAVKDRFDDVISRVEMPGLSFYISKPIYTFEETTFPQVVNGCIFYLQVKCNGTCNVTGKPQKWSGRKWQLSEHMTDQEIVQTALKAVLTAYEHEIREQFKYRGVSVFDPHYDIEKLVELREQPDSVVERKKASTRDMAVQVAGRVKRTSNYVSPEQVRHLILVSFYNFELVPWLRSYFSGDDVFYYTEIREVQNNNQIILKTDGCYSLLVCPEAVEYVLSKIHNCKKAYLGVHAKHRGQYVRPTVGFLFSELSELVG